MNFFFHLYSLNIFISVFSPFQWVSHFLTGFFIQAFVSTVLHCFSDLQSVIFSIFKAHLTLLSYLPTSKFYSCHIITCLELPLELLLLDTYNFHLRLSFIICYWCLTHLSSCLYCMIWIDVFSSSIPNQVTWL